MHTDDEIINIVTVTNDGVGPSQFSSREVVLSGDELRRLSAQIPAENFRLRTSGAAYASGYHVAGDPTLLIILSGSFRLLLRTGEFQDFGPGEMFIAQDYLTKDIEFDDSKHGHRAQVLGDAAASVLHLKLEKR